jgi:RNA polymerase sigma-70 factor, ECF subfamily
VALSHRHERRSQPPPLRRLSRRRVARRRVRSRRGAASLSARTPDAKAEDPTSGAERDEVRERVRSAVAELPENQRVAVALLRFHEFTYEEIARTMSLSVPAVKSLLNRAKDNLRRALAPDLESALRPAAANAAKGSP